MLPAYNRPRVCLRLSWGYPRRLRFFGATGGEPLLRKDLIEVLEYATKKGIRTGFATNGFFLDEKVARKIKDAGISSIQVSLDGTEEIHNKIRLLI